MVPPPLFFGVNTSWKFLESFDSFPSGKMQHVALPGDIELVLLDFISTGSVEQSFSIDRSPIIFSFHLSGQAHGMLRHSPVRTEPVACGPGNAWISFNPESSCKTILGDRQHYQIINIYIVVPPRSSIHPKTGSSGKLLTLWTGWPG